MVDRAAPEDSNALAEADPGVLEPPDLDHHAHQLEEEDATDEGEQDLLPHRDGEESKQRTEGKTAGIAHEDLGRTRVEPQESETRAGHRARDDHEILAGVDVGHEEIGGELRTAPDPHDDHEGDGGDRHDARRESVHAVGDVDRIARPRDDQRAQKDEGEDSEHDHAGVQRRNRRDHLGGAELERGDEHGILDPRIRCERPLERKVHHPGRILDRLIVVDRGLGEDDPGEHRRETDLEEELLPGKKSVPGPGRPAGGGQLQPVVGHADETEGKHDGECDMDVAFAQVGEQDDAGQDGPADQDPAHRRGPRPRPHQLVDARVVELGCIAHLLSHQPGDGPGTEPEDETEGDQHREKGPELDLIEDAQHGDQTGALEWFLEGLDQYRDHGFDSNLDRTPDTTASSPTPRDALTSIASPSTTSVARRSAASEASGQTTTSPSNPDCVAAATICSPPSPTPTTTSMSRVATARPISACIAGLSGPSSSIVPNTAIRRLRSRPTSWNASIEASTDSGFAL